MSEHLDIDLQISGTLRAAVEELAATSGVPPVEIAAQALEDYVAWRIPQLRDLQEAIAAADRDEFADDDEVASVFAKYDA